MVTDHNGAPTRENEVFFAPPDPTIGRISSRHTSVGKSYPPRRPGWEAVRLVALGCCLFVSGALTGAILGTIATVAAGLSTPLILFGAAVLGGAVGASLSVTFRRESRVCSYVGVEGIARHEQRDGGGPSTCESLRFANARRIRATETPIYKRGREVGIAFDYSWHNPVGSEIFALRGFDHTSRSDFIAPWSPIHFARAARLAFEQHLGSRRAILTRRATESAGSQRIWPFPGLAPSPRQSSEPLPLM